MTGDYPQVSHNQLKRYTRLLDAKFRREEGIFLAEGVKVVEELLKSNWQVETMLVLPEKESYWHQVLLPAKDKFPVYQLNRSDWKRLSQDKEPEGLLAIVKRKEQSSLAAWMQSAEGNLLVVCEISNPQNLGALIRSACWFGFSGILLTTNSVDWTHPKVVRASMGGVFHLPVLTDIHLDQLLSALMKEYIVIGSDVHRGMSPRPLNQKALLLVGSESHGLPENILVKVHERWRIPGGNESDSLSLPQAAAIMMYEMSKHES